MRIDADASQSPSERAEVVPSFGSAGPALGFVRQLGDEMRKVAWPTRTETLNHAGIVSLTLVVIISLIFTMDFVFSGVARFVFK